MVRTLGCWLAADTDECVIAAAASDVVHCVTTRANHRRMKKPETQSRR